FRVLLIGGVFCVLTGLVGARLVRLQVTQFDEYNTRATRQHTKRVVLQPERGEILDRKGRPLATSTGTLSVYIDPKYFREPHADVDLDALANQVSYYTSISPTSIRARLNGNAVTAIGR